MRDPRIIAQKLRPRFSLQNPLMVRIRTLRITYIYSDLYTAIYILYIGVYIRIVIYILLSTYVLYIGVYI